MSDIDNIKEIISLELIEAVENRKKTTVKNRNKDNLIKRFCMYKSSVFHLLELIKTIAQYLMGSESHAILRPINTPLFSLKLTKSKYSN